MARSSCLIFSIKSRIFWVRGSFFFFDLLNSVKDLGAAYIYHFSGLNLLKINETCDK